MTEIKRSGQQSGQTLVSCLSGTSTPAPCSCMWLGYDLAESLSLAKAIQEPQSFRHCWSTLTFFPEFQKPRRRCYGFLLPHCTPRPEPHNGECSIHSQHASCPGHGCLRPGGFSQANDGLERVGPLSVAGAGQALAFLMWCKLQPRIFSPGTQMPTLIYSMRTEQPQGQEPGINSEASLIGLIIKVSDTLSCWQYF